MSDLAAALMVAIRVHAGQVDKQGEPYLLHVLRVVEVVSDEAKVVAALHDVLGGAPGNIVVEPDGHLLSLSDLVGFVHLSMAEEAALDALTRQEGEVYADYIEGIRAGYSSTWVAQVREVKIADLRDNLGRIPPEPFGRPLAASVSAWRADWAPLKARYERALASLGGSQG